MSSAVIAGLVLVMSATAVLGTGENGGSSECVSEQELAQELAAVKTAMKAEMERRVDQLHSQLHYWQNVTVNILKDHYSSLDSGPASECSSATAESYLQSAVLNITQSNQEIKERLDATLAVNERMNKRLDSMEDSIAQQNSTGQCPNDSFLNPAHNCSHILHNHPLSTSGIYWLQSSPGYAVKVFCDMERVCGCDVGRRDGGGWIRVANINMSRTNETCPAGFRKVTASGKTMCGGQSSRCTSTTFSCHGLQYSRVCGKIIGYQLGRTNALNRYITQTGSIDTNFVDGIVLTHGNPRIHIWTFIAGIDQYSTNRHSCPCNGASYVGPIPPYIGNDYFCDSGYRYNTDTPLTYLTNDPLWDGAGCVRGSCCTFNSPPWFCKTLPHPTTDDIELRLCLDEVVSNEDTPFETVELYVQ